MPAPTEEIDHGVPLFLDQLGCVARRPKSNPEIAQSALQHGHDLLLQGSPSRRSCTTMATSVRPITELAVETNAPISTDDFRTLNRAWTMRSRARSPIRTRAESVESRRGNGTRQRAPRVFRP